MLLLMSEYLLILTGKCSFVQLAKHSASPIKVSGGYFYIRLCLYRNSVLEGEHQPSIFVDCSFLRHSQPKTLIKLG